MIYAKHFNDTSQDSFLVSIEKIAKKRYLYAPLHPNGYRDFYPEQKLSELENILADVWPYILSETPDLTKDSSIRKALSIFSAVMILRHPLIMDGFREESIKYIKKKANRFDQSDEILEYAAKKKGILYAVRDGWGSLSEIIRSKNWVLFNTEKPVFFTSDKPISISVFKGKEFYTFPLSPNHFLAFGSSNHAEKSEIQFVNSDYNNALSLNMMTIDQSHKFLFSHRPIEEYINEINKK